MATIPGKTQEEIKAALVTEILKEDVFIEEFSMDNEWVERGAGLDPELSRQHLQVAIRPKETFKAYVHRRLNGMGVPEDPEPEKNAKTGCRIEGRLNYLEKMIEPPIQVDYLSMVSKFHLLFQHPILDTPQIPNEQRCKLRMALITEEANEFCEAVAAGDLIGIADALCDLQYVLSGTVLEFGMKLTFPLMFAEVQRSNMSKACSTRGEAEATIDAYTTQAVEAGKLVDEMHYEEKDGKFLVYRTKDRKTLKSINYSPANLYPFITVTD